MLLLALRCRGLHARTQGRPLVSKGGCQVTASKEIGTSVLKPHEMILPTTSMNLEADSAQSPLITAPPMDVLISAL